jgi:two-component system phosphate regulon sensor histidine kinase PhoR
MTFFGRLTVSGIVAAAISIGVMAWWHPGVFGTSLLIVAVGVALGIVANRWVTTPLRALGDASRAVAAGESPRLPRSGVPAVDALAASLQRLHEGERDRTAALAREQAGANAIVNTMVEGVIAADANGRITMANPAAHRLLGYPADAALPDLRLLFRDRLARDAVAHALAGSPVTDAEFELETRTVSLSARPLSDGLVLVLHDLTAVRRLEAVRRDFVANVSHELKTPLTSIAGYADTLLDGNVDAAMRQHFLDVIISNAHRMQRLVDDLLDLSRVESGRWEPHATAIALQPLIREAWDQLAERATAKSVSLDMEIGTQAATAWIDGDAVRQVLSNLLDNAVRYAPVNTAIMCRTMAREGGVAIQIVDHGSGVASEHLDRIFERFYRVDPARSRVEGGTGLGLAIVRHLVEAHGGWVTAESALNEGMTVTCWFPDPPQA